MGTSTRATVTTHPTLLSQDGLHAQDLYRLQKAAQRITSILDLDQLIDQIAHEVCGIFGCVESNIYLHDPQQNEMVLSAVHGCQAHGKGHRLKIGEEGMVGYVALTGQMRYAPDVSKDPYFIPCEESIRSETAIPLECHGKMVGVFTASHSELDAFTPDQLRLMQALAGHIGVAVHNASLFQEERRQRQQINREVEDARVIQQALFPKASPYTPGFAVQGVSVPAGAVGGDWYDYLAVSDNSWGLVLADVSGKGMAAALLMSATRGILRSLSDTCHCPGQTLSTLNRALLNDFPGGRFVTMVYGILNPGKRTLTFANAGHLLPLLVDSKGARFLESETGLPLGVAATEFSASTVDLEPGSRMLFYSDGITETTNPAGEEYGIARLAEYTQRADASAFGLLDTVREFAAGQPAGDDATVILIQSLAK